MRIDEIAVGARAACSRTITDADIRAFAEATGDVNPVHLDDAAASRSIFGGRVAHGMLGAGLISAVLGTQLPGPGTIYLAQSLRFTKPVRIGDTITATVEVLEVLAPKRRVRLATRCSNQRGEVVLDGEATVMVPDA